MKEGRYVASQLTGSIQKILPAFDVRYSESESVQQVYSQRVFSTWCAMSYSIHEPLPALHVSPTFPLTVSSRTCCNPAEVSSVARMGYRPHVHHTSDYECVDVLTENMSRRLPLPACVRSFAPSRRSTLSAILNDRYITQNGDYQLRMT